MRKTPIENPSEDEFLYAGSSEPVEQRVNQALV
jgi:hypothetical protein